MKIPAWNTLTDDEKDLYVRLLWFDGHSNQEIGDFLGTTKNAIAGRRHRLKLRNENRTRAQGAVNPRRFNDLLDLHEMKGLEEQGVSSIAPPAPHEEEKEEEPKPAPQAAAPQPLETTCRWPLSDSTKLRPHLCGKQAVEGHVLCEEHLALALGKK